LRRILTINSGSSSIKFSMYEMDHLEHRALSGSLDRIGFSSGVFQAEDEHGQPLVQRQLDLPDHASALRALLTWLDVHAQGAPLDAVGHRVAHGGTRFIQPHMISPALLAAIKELIPLAPEHLPHQIAAIEAVTSAYPGTRQVACFDTAFHRHMPPVAQWYALPRYLMDEGVMRYGFHGLSYEYIMSELAREAPDDADGRVIIAHLGNGCSMAAIHHGRSLDTTMGFTPTGGLVMSTRSGDLDPGVVLYLLEEKGLDTAAVRRLVSHEAGLLGVSGISSDMQDLLGQEPADPRAELAVSLFCHYARKHVAGLAATLAGLDTLIFTAGIGEHSAAVRQRICDGLEFLGIHLDAARNAVNAAIISTDASAVTVRVMQTNEELMIARHTSATLERHPSDQRT
jgi:acetate kinase